MKKKRQNKVLQFIILFVAIILAFTVSILTSSMRQSRDVSGYYIKVNENYEQAPKEYNSVYEYYERVSYDFYTIVENPKQEEYGIYYVSLEDGEYKKATDYYKVITEGTTYYTKDVKYYYIPIVPDTSLNLFSKENLHSSINSVEFWLNTTGTGLMNMTVFFASYNLIRHKRIEEQEFTDLESNYNNHLKKKETDSFTKYAKKINFNRKKEAYKEYYNKKLGKIEKKLDRIPDYKQETKKYKNLLKKKERLEIRLTDTWIENNLHKVPYNSLFDKVHFQEMKTTNYIESSISDVSNYKEKSNEGLLNGRKGLSKTISSIVIGLISALLVFIPIMIKFDTVTLILVLITVSLSCSWQIFSGITYANKIFKQEIKAPIIYKTSMLEDYEKWILENQNIKTDYRKELEEKALCEAKNEIMKKLTEEVESIDEGAYND